MRKVLLLIFFGINVAAMENKPNSTVTVSRETLLEELESIKAAYIGKSPMNCISGRVLSVTVGSPIYYWNRTQDALKNYNMADVNSLSVVLERNSKCTELHAILLKALELFKKDKKS